MLALKYKIVFPQNFSVISDAQPLAIRLPYATITYNLISSSERLILYLFLQANKVSIQKFHTMNFEDLTNLLIDPL